MKTLALTGIALLVAYTLLAGVVLSFNATIHHTLALVSR